MELLDCVNLVHKDSGQSPVMFVSGAVLFPDCSVPLRIFEPRYTSMLDDALESSRTFILSFEEEDNFEHGMGTMGLITILIFGNTPKQLIIPRGKKYE